MKKLVVTIAIVLGMGLTTFAQDMAFAQNEAFATGGGLMGRGGIESGNVFAPGLMLDLTSMFDTPGLPNHGMTDNQNAPLGSGIALLLGLGGAYLVAKKRKEQK